MVALSRHPNQVFSGKNLPATTLAQFQHRSLDVSFWKSDSTMCESVRESVNIYLLCPMPEAPPTMVSSNVSHVV